MVLPEIRKIVREELQETNTKVDDLRTLVDDRFKAVDDRFKAVDERLKAVEERLGWLTEKYDLAKDFAVLQAKVTDLEGKLGQR